MLESYSASRLFVSLKPSAKLRKDAQGRLKRGAIDACRQRLSPWLLEAHSRVGERPSFRRQRHQLGALVMRIWTKFDHPAVLEFIDNPLHRLPRESHCICDAHNRSWFLLKIYRAEHLPTRACKIDLR